MPPKPIEDIDFPALGDQILELLLAVWILVCETCLTAWDYVSQTLWAVWTYPPFETFRNALVAALIVLMDYVLVVVYLITYIVIAVLAFIIIMRVLQMLQMFFLYSLGFRGRGVLLGSYAANYQSTSYGGNVPRGSTFSRIQSQGAQNGGGYRTVDGTVYVFRTNV